MGVVGYRCPTSGEDVTTAIETSKDTLVKMRAMDLTIWVWCPHCMAGHQIKPADAVLEGEIQTIFGSQSLIATDALRTARRAHTLIEIAAIGLVRLHVPSHGADEAFEECSIAPSGGSRLRTGRAARGARRRRPTSRPASRAPLGTAQVRSVLDGRTVQLTDGREVRLAGIEVPPKRQRAKSGAGNAGVRPRHCIAAAGRRQRPLRQGRGAGFGGTGGG